MGTVDREGACVGLGGFTAEADVVAEWRGPGTDGTMPAGVGILNRGLGARGAVVDEALNTSEGIVVQHDF